MTDKHQNGWIGFDLDGTLAKYEKWGDGSIGEPIPSMISLVCRFLSLGYECRIVTARVSGRDELETQQQRDLIQHWCLKHIGIVLEVTHQKDFSMYCLFDDRAIAVKKNEGIILGHCDSLNLKGIIEHG